MMIQEKEAMTILSSGLVLYTLAQVAQINFFIDVCCCVLIQHTKIRKKLSILRFNI